MPHQKIVSEYFVKTSSNIMFIDDDDQDSYYVAMGLISGDPELPLAHHIYVDSKAPWHEITDDLKQHDQDPFQNE